MRRQGLRAVPAPGGGLSKRTTAAKQIYLLPPAYKQKVIPRSAEDRDRMHEAEIQYLQDEIKRLEGVVAFKNGVLLYVADYFEGVLANNNPQSFEQIKRMVSQLKGAAARYRGGLPE